MTISETTVREFETALLALDRLTATRLLTAPEGGESPMRRVEQLVAPTLDRIGRAWEYGQVALSQVYMSGRICEDLVDALLPSGSAIRKDQPKMAVAVLEDYHLLGKRMVYAVLRASGYELLDYGRQDVEGLARRVAEQGVEILLLSALMLPSALRVARVRAALDRLGCPVRIVVGGAPFRFDPQLWREMGADAMGVNASDAVRIVAALTGNSS